MKKLLATGAILATTLISQSASATDANRFPYWYLGLSAGGVYQNDSDIGGSSQDLNWDTGVVASAQIGYQPPGLRGFRPELEYSYRNQDFDGGKSRVSLGAANLYYDFFNASQFTPYIGGGLGYGSFHLSDGPGGGATGHSTQGIYQAMIGVGYDPVTIPNVGFTLGYRYMAPFDEPDAGGHKYEYDSHSIEAGAKFRF